VIERGDCGTTTQELLVISVNCVYYTHLSFIVTRFSTSVSIEDLKIETLKVFIFYLTALTSPSWASKLR